MSRLEGIAVLALIEALAKVGETFFDGDRKDDFEDVLEALKSVFGFGSDCKEKEEP